MCGCEYAKVDWLRLHSLSDACVCMCFISPFKWTSKRRRVQTLFLYIKYTSVECCAHINLRLMSFSGKWWFIFSAHTLTLCIQRKVTLFPLKFHSRIFRWNWKKKRREEQPLNANIARMLRFLSSLKNIIICALCSVKSSQATWRWFFLHLLFPSTLMPCQWF